MKSLSDFEVTKNFTGGDKPYKGNRYELIANEGYLITDSIIYETSGFNKKIKTTHPEKFGTIEEKYEAEIIEIQDEIKKQKEEAERAAEAAIAQQMSDLEEMEADD